MMTCHVPFALTLIDFLLTPIFVIIFPTLTVSSSTRSRRTFKGDKWDAFYPELPKALTSHLNGNAIYNLTSKVLNDVVDLLEDENGGSIPYDYRISQLALSNGYSDLKETKLIANYAASNILPKHITADAAIVHGANIYENWNDQDEVSRIRLLNRIVYYSVLPILA